MRSARVILATAAAAAVIGMGAPGAFAAGSDWEKEDSGYSKKEDSGWSKEDSSKEESSKEDSGKEEESGYLEKHPEDAGKSKDDYGKPHGGVHTGGGALTLLNEGDWGTAKDPKHDPETYKDKDGKKEDSEWSKEDSGYSKEDSWGEKPSGGVHTGGGGLAAPSVTTGGVAVLGVAAAGLYMARRKKTAGSVA
ncbi:hypothetical protein [Streptomyces phaeofaciens]|uniref:hypothetical protein n=1 Tax=Streptomyces phaeofaciens TaxID=68254 RepID=UPI00369181A3